MEELTKLVPAYSPPCWNLFQLERGVAFTTMEAVLLRENFVKETPFFTLTDLGKKYLEIVKNSELEKMYVSINLLELFYPIFFKALNGTQSYSSPFVEDLISANLLINDNRVSVTNKGLKFVFGYASPSILAGGVKLYLQNPAEYNENVLIRGVPFDIWGIVLSKLDNNKGKFNSLEKKILESLIEKLNILFL